MLRRLRVADLALVAGAEAAFGPGLNLLTGETGSGKSLIVEALGLCLGARASAEQVRHGSERARVEAEFDGLVLAREIGRRSAALVGGRAATVEQLREAGRDLVQVHGQHEHQALLDPEAQTLLLDAYAGALEARRLVAAAHRAYADASSRLRDLQSLEARGRREEEYLRWQLQELTRAALLPGEDEELAQERGAVRHAARLAEMTAGARQALDEERGLLAAVSGMRAAAELDPRLAALAGRMEALAEEAAGMATELRAYGERLEADPGRLEALEERLAELEAIKRKYGGSLEEAIEERERLRSRLGEAADLGAALEAAGRASAAARQALD
ncbi:MAG: AAA family ATPase, partial [Candidatus Dormibacterales bacterium]